MDFAKDPIIRRHAREWMLNYGIVTISPTERGMTAIDKFHAYYVSAPPAQSNGRS
jgi:transcription elongation factor SPT6